MRPAGSLLTPIIYLSAFTRGYGPASLVWDIPAVLGSESAALESDPAALNSDPEAGEETSTRTRFLGPLRLRLALANDVLQPAETLARQLGWDVLRLTAQLLGLASLSDPAFLPASASLLQEGQLSLLDAAVTYSIFSNSGRLAGQTIDPQAAGKAAQLEPSSVIQLLDYNQSLWLDWSSPQGKPVISEPLAYVMNHVLSDEPARWQSLGHPNPLEIGRPAGAKLGVTENGLDSWAVGYTPELVAGVWLGKTGLSPATISPTAAAGLWHAVMQFASQSAPVQTWERPAGVNVLDVCDPSGLLPTVYCPSIVSEIFLTGSEPHQTDNLYRAFQVNRETGRLATVFTPPELVEEKVFLVIPPEAAAWAAEASLPTPPDAYDGIYLAGESESAAIQKPAMFAHVRGEVTFSGTAGGADFDFYRLQVGQGLNPQGWTQLGEDSQQPVDEDVLGQWDTTGLSGLFAVQLVVVNKDQRIERALIQVTVDNELPQVQIVSPTSDQEITFSTQASLVLQASVRDNLEISRVEFIIDRNPVAALQEAPYLISWRAVRGEHTLLVRAFDLAGNESETALKFTVK
jgi:membrane carboxypeptidase/penicillin-binding protein PbpC